MRSRLPPLIKPDRRFSRLCRDRHNPASGFPRTYVTELSAPATGVGERSELITSLALLLLYDGGLEEELHELENAAIAHAPSHQPEQSRMVDRVEGSYDTIPTTTTRRDSQNR